MTKMTPKTLERSKFSQNLKNDQNPLIPSKMTKIPIKPIKWSKCTYNLKKWVWCLPKPENDQKTPKTSKMTVMPPNHKNYWNYHKM